MKSTILSSSLALLLLILPSCVAAIGNSATGVPSLPRSTEPLLAEKVQAAERVVTLREQKLDVLRSLRESGRAGDAEMVDAEIELQESKIRLLQLRAELQAMKQRDSDDD